METLKNWSARRSGGRITINGLDETGHPEKVPNVDTIVIDAGEIIATDKNGEKWRLGRVAA
ncbi:hypothetical protein [Brevundimonas sp.]|uniref:hypothetical protein n=1 Tax=Brevundimonas sp. TaxID=1871086 RepID=UPI00286D600B|nr:hypothetical protein [Brevundimonas sp.]